MVRVFLVAGTRPNFIKIAPLYRAFVTHALFDPVIVHTGQHYDKRMNEVFFQQLELPPPHHYLGVGSGSHAQQTADVMVAIEQLLIEKQPDLVVVVGDVNSTMAATLAASKLHIPVAHVEAGLRSFDRRMPEEINRLVTDSLSTWLYVTEQSGLDNLTTEGVSDDQVSFAGNVMIDSLVRFRENAQALHVAKRYGLERQNYVLMTMHRPSNVDSLGRLQTIVDVIQRIATSYPLVFPVHPRTAHHLKQHGLFATLEGLNNLYLLEPIGYLEFLSLMMDARILVTDSGGIQEEATFLGVPCATVRENTERPITISHGTNKLLSLHSDTILQAVEDAFVGRWKTGQVPPLWDGYAAERIVAHLATQI